MRGAAARPPFHRTFPIGLDVEVCTFSALERAWKESTQTFHREHVMPYIYEGAILARVSPVLATGISPRGFIIAQLNNDDDFGGQRWTVDTAEDLAFIREVFSRLDDEETYSWRDVLSLVKNDPRLGQINASVKHKTMIEVDERAKKK